MLVHALSMYQQFFLFIDGRTGYPKIDHVADVDMRRGCLTRKQLHLLIDRLTV